MYETRTELRDLYKNYFTPSLEDFEERRVEFSSVMYLFRSKVMKIIVWQPPGERENIIYRKGPKVAMDHTFVLRRQARSSG